MWDVGVGGGGGVVAWRRIVMGEGNHGSQGLSTTLVEDGLWHTGTRTCTPTV